MALVWIRKSIMTSMTSEEKVMSRKMPLNKRMTLIRILISTTRFILEPSLNKSSKEEIIIKMRIEKQGLLPYH